MEKALWLYTNSKDGGKNIYETAMKFKSEATYKHDQNQLPTATSGDWMVPTQGRLTSGYGDRSFDNHHGIDIAQKEQFQQQLQQMELYSDPIYLLLMETA